MLGENSVFFPPLTSSAPLHWGREEAVSYVSTKKVHVYLMNLYKSVILLLSVPWRVLSFPYIDRLDPVLLVATPVY